MNETRRSGETERQSDIATCQLDIQQWYRRVYALCQSRLFSQADAEDAAQETFVRGFSRLGELRSPEALGGWLRQIAHNVCVDMIRREKVRRTSATDINQISSVNEVDATSVSDQREHLIRLIHALPQPLREIILLHYYDNMTYDEMAQWLDVARSTVNERLSKARNLLKQQLISTENAP